MYTMAYKWQEVKDCIEYIRLQSFILCSHLLAAK